MKVLFYVQHLLGIGHLARASLIAQALRDNGDAVTMVMGGLPVPGFPGPGIDTICLPPVVAGPGGFSDLVDETGAAIDADFKQTRTARLLDALTAHTPDILLIEAFPFGRRQMRFELLPLLRAARGMAKPPVIACSLRDILQHRSLARHRETCDLANRYFDHVLVHGDPTFVRLDETFPLAGELAPTIWYTGIVSADPGRLEGAAFDVVVSAGGGAAGAGLLRNSLASRPLTRLADADWCILTGPNIDRETAEFLAAHAGDGVHVETSRSDFRALLASARLSISQAGYNTMADVLRARCAAVAVPFAAAGESEQTMRAGRLADRGLIAVLSEDGLTPAALAGAVDDALARPQVTAAGGSIDLDGAGRTAIILNGIANG